MRRSRRPPEAVLAARRAYFQPVREAMRAQHVSRDELARRVGVPGKTLEGWLYGFYLPSPEFMRAAVEALDYPQPLVKHWLTATPPPRSRVGHPPTRIRTRQPERPERSDPREEQPA